MSSEPTVFVVDDDPSVLKAISLSLSKRGYSVEAHPSAESFLAAYDSARPGCLVLDLRLSGMTGFQLQDTLNQQPVKIPIIFISGHGDIPATVHAIKEGAVDFLEKPVRQELLLDRIDEALSEDQRNREIEAQRRGVMDRFAQLTSREREILAMLVADSVDTSTKGIARQLGISPRTVESHRARIIEKMQAKSIPDLVAMAKVCRF